MSALYVSVICRLYDATLLFAGSSAARGMRRQPNRQELRYAKRRLLRRLSMRAMPSDNEIGANNILLPDGIIGTRRPRRLPAAIAERFATDLHVHITRP